MKLELKEWANKVTSWIKGKSYVGCDSAITITSYNSTSNYYTVPKDGLLRVFCSYVNGNYIGVNVGNSDGTNYLQYMIKSTGTANNIIPVPVFEGQRVYISPNNGSNNVVSFIGFTTK